MQRVAVSMDERSGLFFKAMSTSPKRNDPTAAALLSGLFFPSTANKGFQNGWQHFLAISFISLATLECPQVNLGEM
jgi:hypothetical protein